MLGTVFWDEYGIKRMQVGLEDVDIDSPNSLSK